MNPEMSRTEAPAVTERDLFARVVSAILTAVMAELLASWRRRPLDTDAREIPG